MRTNVAELFDSGVSVSLFVDQMQNELSPFREAEDWRYREWINTLEQLIYSEIVRYESFSELDFPYDFSINYTEFLPPEGIAPVRAGDIFAVSADGVFLSHGRDCDSDMARGTYFDRAGRLRLNIPQLPKKVTVYFNARPRLITEADIGSRNICVPPEFIDLFRSRVRGEFYKLVDEDGLSAKWISEYNAVLEDFKQWCQSREELYH